MLGFHATLYGNSCLVPKSGQEPNPGELTDPRGDATTIILINGQRIYTNIIFNKNIQLKLIKPE